MQDLFSLIPTRYIDRSRFYKINELQPNSSEVQLVGEISGFKEIKQKRGSRFIAVFKDNTGTIDLVWFKGGKWLKDTIKEGKVYVIYGKLNFYNGNFSVPHPEIELLSLFEKSLRPGIQPVYPSTEKLTSRGVSNKIMCTILEHVFRDFFSAIGESLSENIIKKFDFLSKREALLNIHFPKNQEILAKAEHRLKFEEFFFYNFKCCIKR